MLTGINEFFEGYAAAMERQDTKYMANCYALPCMFISDDSSLTYSDIAKLESLINKGKHFFAVHGITSALPDVQNKLSVTEKIARVKLQWQYLDKKGKTVYTCDYFYILKQHQRQWKIETAISINEKDAIERLNKKAAK